MSHIQDQPREKHFVFVTGGTGFMGRQLIQALLSRGHAVRALVRSGSEKKLHEGCEAVLGDPLSADSIRPNVAPADTFIQLVGVSHPNPAKAEQFRNIDYAAGCAGLEAALAGGAKHFVYVSVAQPAPIMRSYIAVRADVERRIRESGINATILRPWYVLGPGRRWPVILKPIYALIELLPPARPSALRLGLLTEPQMTTGLVNAVENPPNGIRILEVPQIRAAVL